jgi:hypothetical protein
VKWRQVIASRARTWWQNPFLIAIENRWLSIAECRDLLRQQRILILRGLKQRLCILAELKQ